MPNTTWEAISDIQHKCKNALELAYKIEMLAHDIRGGDKYNIIKTSMKLRRIIGEELEKLNEIILEQTDDGTNDTNNK